jgi:ketosteroid isomerase-like protein
MRFLPGLAAAILFACAVPAQAAPADDALHAVTIWLDKFNAGDMDAFFAGHADNAVIIDEFPPYVWTGAKVPQTWAQDYDADAKRQNITDPRMDYAAPIRAESDGESAYVVLPTVYRFKQNGKSMSAAGTMTFGMTNAGGKWKIASWTYSAPAPAADR